MKSWRIHIYKLKSIRELEKSKIVRRHEKALLNLTIGLSWIIFCWFSWFLTRICVDSHVDAIDLIRFFCYRRGYAKSKRVGHELTSLSKSNLLYVISLSLDWYCSDSSFYLFSHRKAICFYSNFSIIRFVFTT